MADGAGQIITLPKLPDIQCYHTHSERFDMKLDDPGWSLVDQKLGPGVELPKVLRKIAAMRDWSADKRPPSGDSPGDYLTQATYNFGDIRNAAYAVVPHIVEFAGQNRRPAEQVNAMLFVLDIVLGPLEGVAAIPWKLVEEFEQSLLKMGVMAEAILRSGQLAEGARKIAVAAGVLGSRELVAARLAYGLALENLVLPCPTCGSDIEFQFTRDRWIAQSGVETELIRFAGEAHRASDFAKFAELASTATLGDEYDHIGELEATVECPACSARSEILALAEADVAKRCPLARVEGWRPENYQIPTQTTPPRRR